MFVSDLQNDETVPIKFRLLDHLINQYVHVNRNIDSTTVNVLQSSRSFMMSFTLCEGYDSNSWNSKMDVMSKSSGFHVCA